MHEQTAADGRPLASSSVPSANNELLLDFAYNLVRLLIGYHGMAARAGIGWWHKAHYHSRNCPFPRWPPWVTSTMIALDSQCHTTHRALG